MINRKNKIRRFYLTGRLLEENNIELIVDTFKRLVNYKLFIIGYRSKFFKKNFTFNQRLEKYFLCW